MELYYDSTFKNKNKYFTGRPGCGFGKKLFLVFNKFKTKHR